MKLEIKTDRALDKDLYGYILSNIERFSRNTLKYLLQEHELNLLSDYISNKFPDTQHNRSTIKQMIKEELL